MAYGDDVYHRPERLGLTPIFETDRSSGLYEFDMLVVWRHEDGSLYWAEDSGCSCPSPFEDFDSLDHLSTGNLADFHAFAMEWSDPSRSRWPKDVEPARVDVVEFLGRLARQEHSR